MIKDEHDIIEDFVRYMLQNVDEMIVADNLSTDGSREILAELEAEFPQLSIVDDTEVAYYQSVKTTNLAYQALARGHQWVIPADADEIWYSTDRRPLRDFLGGIPDVQIVTAQLFNHLPTAIDPTDGSVFERIGWRKKDHAPLTKVACRLHPELVIHAGNHGAYFPGVHLTSSGLVVRHFSWRSPAQYLRKIRNGEIAYKATSLPETTGAHWRMFENATDEAVMDHFRQWFFSANPETDDSLIYDPTPYSDGGSILAGKRRGDT